MTDSDRVVIVGMGPVGATLALLLGRAGVPTLVLERDAAPFAGPRAVALDDQALRVLQSAGIRGDRVPLVVDRALQFVSAAGDPVLELAPQLSSHGHPAVAFFHQPDLELALRAAVADQGSVEVLLGHELEDFSDEQDHVRVKARDLGSGRTQEVRGRWLIGCDGARGTVRRHVGIRLRGFTSRRRWLVVDVSGAGDMRGAPFRFIGDPARPTVSVPLPGRAHRWEFMLLPGEDADRFRRPEQVRALVAHRTGYEEFDLLRASVYRFHARVAERFGHRRVLLAGDAAHLSPPFAGLGLSSGLRDAHNLAWKLAAVAHRHAGAGLLRSYEAERRPEAMRLIARAVALGAIVQTTRRPLATLRDVALGTATKPPSVQEWIAGGRWKPRSTYRTGFIVQRSTRRPGEGAQLPQPAVRAPDGAIRLLDDVLGSHFSVLGRDVDPWAALNAESRRALKAIGAKPICVHSGSATSCESREVTTVDGEGLIPGWFAQAGASMALVRPDRHVYAVFEPQEAASVIREFSRALSAG